MSIWYDINPELNIIIYICEGFVTGSDILDTADIAYIDTRRKAGMISICDFLSATVDFELQDMKRFLRWNRETIAKNLEEEQVVMITQNKGLHIACNTLKLLSSDIPLKLSAFYTFDEAICSLFMHEERWKIVRFFNDCRNRQLVVHDKPFSQYE